MKILIIEDNNPSAWLLASALQTVTTDVDVANTMAGAWQFIEASNFPYRVVFLDLGLSDSTPDESIQAIERLKQKAKVVAITTGYENTRIRELCKKADAFLFKYDLDFFDKAKGILEKEVAESSTIK